MPEAARLSDPTMHGSPLAPGIGSLNVQIGFQPAWRALPNSMASAVEGLSNAMKSFMSKPQMTPADATADLAQISSGLSEVGSAGASAGAPGAAAAAGTSNAAINTTNTTLTTTWTTASAAPGGQPAANIAYTEGIKAAAAAAASAVMSALASLSDMHVCPLPCPIPPHGPGFVTRGSATVVINNLAASRKDDKVMEACGGSDPIAMGCMTVIIGDDSGSGGGGGGAGGGGGGAAATGGAGGGSEGPPASPQPAPSEHNGPVLPPESPQQPTWIGVKLTDFNGEPMPNQDFSIGLENGQVLSGATDAQGHARFEGIQPGSGEVVFPSIPDEELESQRRQQRGEDDPDQSARDRGPLGRTAKRPKPDPGMQPGPEQETIPGDDLADETT